MHDHRVWDVHSQADQPGGGRSPGQYSLGETNIGLVVLRWSSSPFALYKRLSTAMTKDVY
jgi:hypothetical protein